MSVRKILLIADVGTNERGFYHIGDEAMFWETYRWYQERLSAFSFGALTRGWTHSPSQLTEHEHFIYPIGKLESRFYFMWLWVRFLIFWYFHLPTLAPKEKEFVNTILSYDIWHFTGGGNFYSHSPSWLYYMFFLLLIGHLTGKHIYLISQTIGPFTWFDRIWVRVFLNTPKIIALREPKEMTPDSLTRYGITFPQEKRMLDVAYTALPHIQKKAKRTKKSRYKIGLSAHAFEGKSEEIISILRETIIKLAKAYDASFVVIPHILQENDTEWDTWFMKQCFENIEDNISVEIPTYEEVMRGKKHPVQYIQELTAGVDLLISSRYHGLVFGLAHSVPCVALRGGEYYNQKNRGLLSFVYGKKEALYSVDIRSLNAQEILFQRCCSFLDNLRQEKQDLRARNERLRKKKGLFTLENLPYANA